MKELDNFTMAEYIEHHKLGFSPQDAAATRLICKHLREKGYQRKKARRKGAFVIIWFMPVKRQESLDKLQERLRGI